MHEIVHWNDEATGLACRAINFVRAECTSLAKQLAAWKPPAVPTINAQQGEG